MRTLRAGSGASLQILCLLFALLGTLATVAVGAPQRHSRERSSRATGPCHRRTDRKRRRCPTLHARKKAHHAHGHIPAAGPTQPAGGGSAGSGSGLGSGTAAPWTVVPPSVAPGPAPGAGEAGTSPIGTGGAPPTEAPATGPPHVEVTAEDTEAFRFVLSRAIVPAGEVIVEFVNHGQDEHNLHAVEPAEDAEVGSIPNTPSSTSGQHSSPTLTLKLHRGSYNFFCSLPHHEEKGMKATLKVE